MAEHPRQELDPLFSIGSLGNTLPYEVLLRIYRELELKDRVRASITCRQWRDVYHDPSLWRNLTIKIFSRDSSHADHIKALKHLVETLGQHILYLTVDFTEINQLLSRSAADSLHVCLSGLSNLVEGKSTLKKIAIKNLFLYQDSSFQNSVKFYMVKTLCDFLQCQRSLKIICLQNISVEDFLGSMILESLSRSASVQELQNLNLNHFYNNANHVVDDHMLVVRKMLGSCLNLRTFTANITILRAVGVEFVCRALATNLKCLNIVVIDGYDLPVSEVERREYETSWKLVDALCPRLEVHLYFVGTDLDGVSFVVPDMRLIGLEVRVEGPQQVAATYGTKISKLLDRLTQCCSQSIRDIKLDPACDSDFQSVLSVESVVNCLTTCKKIRLFSTVSNLLDAKLHEAIQGTLERMYGNKYRCEMETIV